MLKLNKETYLDKLHACWIGKNIGGTMGAPYEGRRDFLDVKGFATEAKEPLPNDDLDLQLVWLSAIEKCGPKHFNANVLADYWLDWISPHFNEYGICKVNLRAGLLPPMSGEVDNDKWKTSNGAWIRSEIWASLAPGAPDVAAKYAVMDASVDHGVSEGVNAEIFTSSLQSLAYIESDIRTLINSALEKIPASSMTAKSIRLVIDCYDKGLPYKEAREKVVELNRSLGWFQAPANLGFTVIGLLYGEGDYKKSLIYAINCGDDTDCTAGTVGSTLGIIGGTAAIPAELKEHIGDKIVTCCINCIHSYHIPKTCEELTQRVFRLVPEVMAANSISFEFTDGETEYREGEKAYLNRLTSKELIDRSPYSYDVAHCRQFSVRVEMDKHPRVNVGDERRITLTFTAASDINETRRLSLRLLLPSGWSAEGLSRSLLLEYPQPVHGLYGIVKTEFTVTVGESIDPTNYAYVEVTSPSMIYPTLIPVVFIG